MSGEPSKIMIDPASIISLKAELLNKQNEYRLKKLSNLQPELEGEYEVQKTSSTWGKKRKLDEKAEPKEVPEIDQTEAEEDPMAKSRRMLETKSKYYEQVVSGQMATEEGDDQNFLVDFDLKVSEEARALQAKLGLKNVVDEERFNDTVRQKWERDVLENREKDSVHYQDIRYDEIRNMGVGNFQFSRDEAERTKQMEFFKNMQHETKTRRLQSEIYNLKREIVLKERLMKVKQRRFLKHGYTLEEIKKSQAISEYDQELNEMGQEVKDLQSYAEQTDLHMKSEPVRTTSSNPEEFGFLKTMKRKIGLDREWDKPKLKEKFWDKHVKELRQERRLQFAPPKTYDYSKPKINYKQKHRHQNPATTSSASINNSSFQPPEFYNNPDFYNSLGQAQNQQTSQQPTPNMPPNIPVIPMFQQQQTFTRPPLLPFPPIPPLFMNPPNLTNFNPVMPNLNAPPPSLMATPNIQPQQLQQQPIPVENYETCIIGTSMIKNVSPAKVFSAETNCFFDSISGGCIKNIIDSLEQNQLALKNCRIFIVTCGSNDLDSSYRDSQQVISLYLDLARLLKKLFPNARLVFNKLVPRTSTRHIELTEFEQRRKNFNKFLEHSLPTLVSSCAIVDHYKFEDPSVLPTLLVDGVHFNYSGTDAYTEQIRKTVANLSGLP